jgi:predicted NACHT family NTPase
LEKELRSFRPTQENFVFDDFAPGNGPKRTRILNLHPLAGEQQFYDTQRAPLSADTMVDWAVLSVLPGSRAQRKSVVMAGLTHTATEAVAEFCASGTGVVTLLNRLGAGENEKTLPTYYQVLLRVTIKQGTIIDIAYVAGRVIRIG